MRFDTIKAASTMLIPGSAEHLIRAAEGNLGLLGAAMTVQYSRNGMYIGTALATIGAVGLKMANKPLVFGGIAILSIGLTCLAAKKLYMATYFLRDHMP